MKYLILLLLPFNVFAASFTGTFTAPTEREDGTPISLNEIREYIVFQNGIDIMTIPGTATSYVVEPVPVGPQSYQLVTVDTDGRMSLMSEAVNVTVTSAPPKSASGHAGSVSY